MKKNKKKTKTNNLIFGAIYSLFLLSGVAGLIYQLIWMRKLELIFGNTTFATSSILTAFMGGLALGSYYFGKKEIMRKIRCNYMPGLKLA